MCYKEKPLFLKRMQTILPNGEDLQKFSEITHQEPLDFIRCNTLKITPEKLLARLNKKWQVSQPYNKYPEIFLITSNLQPGELGNSIEHLIGYFYVQEVSSMMSAIALEPKPNELVLDLFASPGSKTTQIAALMNNQGTIIANEIKPDRTKILISNLEKSGVTNTIVTRHDAVSLTDRLSKLGIKFDKILLDAPCSGEGTLRSSPKTFDSWNLKVIQKLSRLQKKFLATTIKLLKKGGTLVYSTCTHAPEENEEIVSYALNKFPLKAETLSLPLKCKPGLKEWDGKKFHKDVLKSCRIYPQDNDSEGFFLAKFTLTEEAK
ncbi:MAG: RsmB/NOP family class I SAM-dependent RNA methyltransferase [archaeon]